MGEPTAVLPNSAHVEFDSPVEQPELYKIMDS